MELHRRRLTQNWLNLPLRTKSLVVLAIPLTTLLTGLFLIVLQNERENQARDQVRHAIEINRALQDLLALLVDAETGIRRYLQTGQEEWLEPYERAQAALPQAMSQLGELLQEPGQRARFDALTPLIGRRLDYLASGRELGAAADHVPVAVPDEVQVDSRAAMDAVRAQIGAMQAAEDELLAVQEKYPARARAGWYATIFGIALVGTIGGVGATILWTKGVHARILQLEISAGRLARGETVVAIAPATDEVGRLADSLVVASGLLRAREEALARWAQVFEHADWGVAVSDADGRLELLNPAYARMHGDAVAALIGRPIDELYPPAALAALGEQAPADEEEESSLYESDHCRRDGAVFPVQVHETVVRDRAGRVLYRIANVQDITARKQAEVALRESNDRLLEAQALAHVGSWDWDPVDNSLIWSPELYRIFGLQPEAVDLTADSFLSLVHPDDRERMTEEYRLLITDARLMESEFRIVRPDGEERVVHGRTEVIRDATGRPVRIRGTDQDITERKQTELALLAANRELEAFSYSVSHDLRAPLHRIAGFAQLLVEDYAADLPPEARHYLERTVAGAQRMGQLIDDLLAFSRLGRQPLAARATDPAAIVEQVVEELAAAQAERMVEISVAVLPRCRADPALLQQVFANLLANALKFTRGREPARIVVGAQPGATTGEHIYFVRDNGAGFDMRYSDKLFGVFQRLHRVDEYEGTGVGLALVQRIIHRHGGRVWAEGAVDQGATFFFSLPAAEPPPTPPHIG